MMVCALDRSLDWMYKTCLDSYEIYRNAAIYEKHTAFEARQVCTLSSTHTVNTLQPITQMLLTRNERRRANYEAAERCCFLLEKIFSVPGSFYAVRYTANCEIQIRNIID